ncbi:MAG: tetratricopeptide repeat protein, partial [Nitrospirales bacterium]
MTDNSASQQGHIYMKRGNLSQALRWFTQAVEEAREQHHMESLSAALGNLGNVSALMEEYDDAETCYKEILSIQRTGEDRNA